MKGHLATALTILALAGDPAAHAQSALPASLRDVGFDQRLGEQVPLELAFRDEAGNTVHLADYFHGKPVILVLAYYRCPMLCTEVLNGLVQALLEMPLDVGKDFEVLTVSFDPRETPELAAAKKRTYLERYGRPAAGDGWHFLTGDQESITALTQAVGFRYRYDAHNDQFAHVSGILVLTPDGKISRYFQAIRFSSRDLRLGLVEASANKVGSLQDQVLLYCFHYDPNEGRYGPTIMNFVRLGGVFTICAIGFLVFVLVRSERRRQKSAAPTGG
jgi:protein SCO1